LSPQSNSMCDVLRSREVIEKVASPKLPSLALQRIRMDAKEGNPFVLGTMAITGENRNLISR
jgi:hypothetical protein